MSNSIINSRVFTKFRTAMAKDGYIFTVDDFEGIKCIVELSTMFVFISYDFEDEVHTLNLYYKHGGFAGMPHYEGTYGECINSMKNTIKFNK